MVFHIANIPSASVKKSNKINNRKSNQSSIDKVRALLEEVKSENSKIDIGDDLYAFVLYTHPMTVERFNEIFKHNSSFRTNVLGKSGQTKSSNKAHVLEIYVYVPQLCDFLPEPNIDLITDFVKLKYQLEEDATQIINAFATGDTASAPSVSPRTKKLLKNVNAEKAHEQLKETINLISMYPRVYKYTDTSENFAPGLPCVVEFPDNSGKDMNTMAYGYYKNILEGKLTLTSSQKNEIRKILDSPLARDQA